MKTVKGKNEQITLLAQVNNDSNNINADFPQLPADPPVIKPAVESTQMKDLRLARELRERKERAAKIVEDELESVRETKRTVDRAQLLHNNQEFQSNQQNALMISLDNIINKKNVDKNNDDYAAAKLELFTTLMNKLPSTEILLNKMDILDNNSRDAIINILNSNFIKIKTLIKDFCESPDKREDVIVKFVSYGLARGIAGKLFDVMSENRE